MSAHISIIISEFVDCLSAPSLCTRTGKAAAVLTLAFLARIAVVAVGAGELH